MALLTLRTLLDHAAEHNYGVAAFNVNNMEQVQAIMEAAHETDSPVIVQASQKARRYMHDLYLRHLILATTELYPHLPIVLHMDRGNCLSHCVSAIECGFTSVMMNGAFREDGETPASFDENVRVTREVVDMARSHQVSVEGELGATSPAGLGPVEQVNGPIDGVQPECDAQLTDPETAEQFVALTRVDALVVSIGTSQGAYKFTHQPDGDVLAMSRIAAIHNCLPNTHLVMRGSSSVPLDLQDMINQYGGDIRSTWGIPLEEIQRGIQNGIRKINVDTDNRIAITGAIRRIFFERPECLDPREYLGPARDAMREVCKTRMIAFGQAGQAAALRAETVG